MDSQDLSRPDRAGHSAFHTASEFTRIAVPDHAQQASRVLVLAGAAVFLLRISGGCGPGDDDLRIYAERESTGSPSRAFGSGSTRGSAPGRAMGERSLTLRGLLPSRNAEADSAAKLRSLFLVA